MSEQKKTNNKKKPIKNKVNSDNKKSTRYTSTTRKTKDKKSKAMVPKKKRNIVVSFLFSAMVTLLAVIGLKNIVSPSENTLIVNEIDKESDKELDKGLEDAIDDFIDNLQGEDIYRFAKKVVLEEYNATHPDSPIPEEMYESLITIEVSHGNNNDFRCRTIDVINGREIIRKVESNKGQGLDHLLTVRIYKSRNPDKEIGCYKAVDTKVWGDEIRDVYEYNKAEGKYEEEIPQEDSFIVKAGPNVYKMLYNSVQAYDTEFGNTMRQNKEEVKNSLKSYARQNVKLDAVLEIIETNELSSSEKFRKGYFVDDSLINNIETTTGVTFGLDEPEDEEEYDNGEAKE